MEVVLHDDRWRRTTTRSSPVGAIPGVHRGPDSSGGLFTGAGVVKTAEQQAIWGGTVGAPVRPRATTSPPTRSRTTRLRARREQRPDRVRDADVRLLAGVGEQRRRAGTSPAALTLPAPLDPKGRSSPRRCERSMAVVCSDGYRPFPTSRPGLRGRTTSSSSPRSSSCARSPTMPDCGSSRPARPAASTTELAAAIGLAKGTIAHHLKVLEKAGLVRSSARAVCAPDGELLRARGAALRAQGADDEPRGRVRLSADGRGGVPAPARAAAATSMPRRPTSGEELRAGRGPLPERSSWR